MSVNNIQDSKAKKRKKYCKIVLVQKGITQEQAAELLGITRRSVNSYVNGKLNSKKLDSWFGWENGNV